MVDPSNAPQKGARKDGGRQAKQEREKSKKANGAPLTASGVVANQALGAQKTIQESQLMTGSVLSAPKEGSEAAVKPKKNKPRPSKSARARIQAAKASLTTEPPLSSTGIVKLARDVKEPRLTTVPASASSSRVPSPKNTHSSATPPTPTPTKVVESTPDPTHKSFSRRGPSKTKPSAWKTAWMLKETTGRHILTIDTTSLQPDNNPVHSTEGFETLCSYNWQNDGTIYIPGGPPKWTPLPLPTTLAQDAGHHFIDQNAARVPKYPFEPAFRALSLMNPGTNLTAVDIVANRNSLRKLLDLSAGKKLDPFCMGLNLVNSTLVISRKERTAQHMVHGAPNSGYGHNFEKAFTTPDKDLGNSSSHHRVIRYRIGPLDCVVRFEVDAYYDDSEHDTTDALTAAMEKLEVAEYASSSTPMQPPDAPTIAIEKGTFISPSLLAEIKAKKLNRMADAMPQLWFGRTPYFINGNHEKGTVHSVSITRAEEQFGKWEAANQEKLRKMVGLLVGIKRTVRGIRGGAAVLVYDVKGGPLKVYRARSEQGVLPKDIVEKYWGV
ncbi:hypothetical protein COCMIDRAFT_86769 [Bipolaris oryzae ATCC 44560]|uniref:Geranylgeranyl pyrophosphate synthetase n=1 Tax=Bipolaris oryzae ATCC 44560 TaxID=930090 RepID=W6ZME8_COCMI|nr:uncharacterized protein COCMIDRAFT_86769 [Bipolaris oryzae ATCC 44560]EUC48689.1 hypothetical protein COCMIDRAFT_86769 [Bipolaris oryzae ATCC 44560]